MPFFLSFLAGVEICCLRANQEKRTRQAGFVTRSSFGASPHYIFPGTILQFAPTRRCLSFPGSPKLVGNSGLPITTPILCDIVSCFPSCCARSFTTRTMASTSTSGTFRIFLSGKPDTSLGSFNYLSGQPLPDAGADSLDADGDEVLLDEADEAEGEADERAALAHARITTAGESIASSATFMRGHGSYLAPPPGAHKPRNTQAQALQEAMAVDVQDAADPSKPEEEEGDEEVVNLIYSALAGPVMRTNKLVSVRALRARYAPEVGDLVVGRIVEVQPGGKRWKVDINSRSEASLLLSSINLPGGVQRKKLESDELQMRAFFKEGDLLVAEVQAVHHDGSVGLHTRSLRYGKLRNGLLAPVQPQLIQRLKSHFATLSKAQVDLVVGMNGYIWVAKHIDFDVDQAEAEGRSKDDAPTTHLQEAQGLGGRGVGLDIEAGAGVYGDQNEVSFINHISMSSRKLTCYGCAVHPPRAKGCHYTGGIFA